MQRPAGPVIFDAPNFVDASDVNTQGIIAGQNAPLAKHYQVCSVLRVSWTVDAPGFVGRTMNGVTENGIVTLVSLADPVCVFPSGPSFTISQYVIKTPERSCLCVNGS